MIKKGADKMGCRRKTKTERELVADIRKTFTKLCEKKNCMECDYKHSSSCIMDYVVDLLEKYEE